MLAAGGGGAALKAWSGLCTGRRWMGRGCKLRELRDGGVHGWRAAAGPCNSLQACLQASGTLQASHKRAPALPRLQAGFRRLTALCTSAWPALALAARSPSSGTSAFSRRCQRWASHALPSAAAARCRSPPHFHMDASAGLARLPPSACAACRASASTRRPRMSAASHFSVLVRALRRTSRLERRRFCGHLAAVGGRTARASLAVPPLALHAGAACPTAGVLRLAVLPLQPCDAAHHHPACPRALPPRLAHLPACLVRSACLLGAGGSARIAQRRPADSAPGLSIPRCGDFGFVSGLGGPCMTQSWPGLSIPRRGDFGSAVWRLRARDGLGCRFPIAAYLLEGLSLVPLSFCTALQRLPAHPESARACCARARAPPLRGGDGPPTSGAGRRCLFPHCFDDLRGACKRGLGQRGSQEPFRAR